MKEMKYGGGVSPTVYTPLTPLLLLISFTYPHVVEPKEWVGREVCDLMAAVSVDQCTVHLYPMAADIKRHQQLEYNGVLRVELTENHEQTCCGASIGKE